MWVKYKDGNPTQVAVNENDNIDDFIEAVQKKLPLYLGQFSPTDISIRLSKTATPLRPGLKISEISNQPDYKENTDENPLIVTVSVPSELTPGM